MTEVVVGPDVVALVKAYLDPLVTPPIHSDVPSTRPARFYRVNAAGGPPVAGKVLFQPQIVLEAWSNGNKPQAATDLALACGYLEASPDFYAECDYPTYLPDPISGTPRYIATVRLAVRGSVHTP